MKHLQFMTVNVPRPTTPDGPAAPAEVQGTPVGMARPGTVWTPRQAALLRPTALPLMGRYHEQDDATPGVDVPEKEPAVIQLPTRQHGNRRMRRALKSRGQ